MWRRRTDEEARRAGRLRKHDSRTHSRGLLVAVARRAGLGERDRDPPLSLLGLNDHPRPTRDELKQQRATERAHRPWVLGAVARALASLCP